MTTELPVRDLGDITKFITRADFVFHVGEDLYEVQPDAATILELQAVSNAGALNDASIISWGARILGGTLDPDTGVITGGQAEKLATTPGMSLAALQRVMMSVVTYYIIGEDFAVEYCETGDWGKALDHHVNVLKKLAEAADTAAEEAASVPKKTTTRKATARKTTGGTKQAKTRTSTAKS